MSLLDTIETNKDLEKSLDEITLNKIRDIYNLADVEACKIKRNLHDLDKGKEFPAYCSYKLENQNLRRDLVNSRESIRQFSQENSELYAKKNNIIKISCRNVLDNFS